jgi:nicotinate phosphoribosyltransferase
MEVNRYPSSLLTDLYQLTMAQVYFQERMFQPATFSLFIRDYPPDRGYFVSAGLENVLDFLASMKFEPDDLDYLNGTGMFSEEFLDFLSALRFSGQVFAIPEGRLFFKDEPVLEVTAPIIEAQLAETAVINMVNLQVGIATKVSRCVRAARGRGVVDFSLRRAQGADAGMAVARAGYIAGLAATSNVLAGKTMGVPTSGTMAHSFVTSFQDEMDAFRAFAKSFGDRTVLLIDTYDTMTGAEKAVRVAKEMTRTGKRLRGVRLDSGDMVALSRQVRDLFDAEGLEEVEIFASGGFDEFKIDRYVRDGAELDAFGVGTKMGVSADAPFTDIAYKLVQFDGRPVLKLSSGKKTLVAPKQVFRKQKDGLLAGDTIAMRGEMVEGDPLLETAMDCGRRKRAPEPLKAIRARFEEEFAKLPLKFKSIQAPATYAIEISDRLSRLQEKVKHRVIQKELGES